MSTADEAAAAPPPGERDWSIRLARGGSINDRSLENDAPAASEKLDVAAGSVHSFSNEFMHGKVFFAVRDLHSGEVHLARIEY